MLQAMFAKLIPRKDPARTITSSALLCIASFAAYKLAAASVHFAKLLIRRRAKAVRSSLQQDGIVYLYIFPKKPQASSCVSSSSTSTSSSVSATNTDDDVGVVVVKKLAKMFSISAPCMAVELFLRINKIPFHEVELMDAADVSPTERLPCIEYNGKVFTDSRFIMDFLEKEFERRSSDAGDHQDDDDDVGKTHDSSKELTDKQRTVTLSNDDNNDDDREKYRQDKLLRKQAEQKTAETAVLRIIESLRLGYGRAVLVDNTNTMISTTAREFNYPKSIVSVLLKLHRRETVAMLNQHGYGDLTQEQFHQVLLEDVKALEFYLSRPVASRSSSKNQVQEIANDDDDDEGRQKDLVQREQVAKEKRKDKSADKLSQFVLGTKVPSKVDCLVAAWLKLLRFYDESEIQHRRRHHHHSSSKTKTKSNKSSTTSSSKSTSSSTSSSTPVSPTATDSSLTTTTTSSSSSSHFDLLGDKIPAFGYLMKSEVFTDYLNRIDSALHKSEHRRVHGDKKAKKSTEGTLPAEESASC